MKRIELKCCSCAVPIGMNQEAMLFRNDPEHVTCASEPCPRRYTDQNRVDKDYPVRGIAQALASRIASSPGFYARMREERIKPIRDEVITLLARHRVPSHTNLTVDGRGRLIVFMEDSDPSAVAFAASSILNEMGAQVQEGPDYRARLVLVPEGDQDASDSEA